MRQLTIIGVVVMILGVIVLVRDGRFTTREDVVKIGDVRITAEENHMMPSWAGGAIVVVGLGLLVAGLRQRT